MDSKFMANRLKPGDPGYVYDKAVDFGGPTEAADWDEDEEESSGSSDAGR
jgi:centrosomal protein CEP19